MVLQGMFHKYKYSTNPSSPSNIGIIAMDIYIPTAYVSQEKLGKTKSHMITNHVS